MQSVRHGVGNLHPLQWARDGESLMSRRTAARLGLAATIVVTLLLGLSAVGRKAWFEHSAPAIATMAIVLGLFAVTAVIWGRSLPVSTAAQTSSFAATGLLPDTELTTRMAAVGAVWPGSSPADGWPLADAADALNAFVAGDGALITAGEMTTPLLYTHEFNSSAMMAEVLPEHTGHRGGDGSVHVLDLLRREGFDGGVA
jgi:hypothetical protein